MSSLRGVMRRAGACALGALLVAGTAVAQELDNADAERNVDEVLVTAQKRVQSLQDVPIVVTAVGQQLLQDTGVRDIKSLTLLTPGLIVTSTSNESSTTARIRGIGTVGDNIGIESSVGVVVDDIYRPRNGVGFGDLGELDSVEVLKGPQGTLFGKNTSAGVINIRTAQPEFEWGGMIEGIVGSNETFEGALNLTGPLVEDKLAGRIFYAYRERDGFNSVVISPVGPRTNTEDMDRKLQTVRAQLLWTPTDDISARLIYDWAEREETCCLGVQRVNGPTAPIINSLAGGAGISIPPDEFRRRAFANRDNEQDVHDTGVSLRVDWDLNALGGASLVSVTGWRDWDTTLGQDSDFSGAGILYRIPDTFGNEFEQISQELRLQGNAGKLDWLVGGFYADEDITSKNALYFDSQFQTYYSLLFSAGMSPTLVGTLSGLGAAAYPLANGQQDDYEQGSRTFAFFTHNNYAFTESFSATIGLRYTDESKDLTSNYFNTNAGAGCAALRNNRAIVNGAFAAAPAGTVASFYSLGCATFADPAFNSVTTEQSLDEDEWSGTAKLIYRINDDVMTYASYARGYKAGGLNFDRERVPAAVQPPPLPPPAFSPVIFDVDPDTSFAPEKADSYEIGVKSQWFANSLAVNATVFYQDYEDFQLNTFTGVQFVVVSIPEVTSTGVDLDFLWYAPVDTLTLQGGVTYAETEYGTFDTALVGVNARLSGSQASFAPKWSGSLAATYEKEISDDLKWRFFAGAKYMSSYNTGSDLAPQKEQDSYTLVNALIGIGAADDSWAIEFWTQNAFDRDYIQVAFDATLQTGTIDSFLGNPATWGATMRVRF